MTRANSDFLNFKEIIRRFALEFHSNESLEKRIQIKAAWIIIDSFERTNYAPKGGHPKKEKSHRD